MGVFSYLDLGTPCSPPTCPGEPSPARVGFWGCCRQRHPGLGYRRVAKPAQETTGKSPEAKCGSSVYNKYSKGSRSGHLGAQR